MPRHQAVCRTCGKPVLFAAVSNKEGRPPSPMPLNPDPDPDGNVAVYKDVTGALVGRVVGKGGDHHGYERLMMPHFATCQPVHPQVAQALAQQQPQNVTQLDDWRRAQAAHNKAKRNRRGKRPANPITGIRINPERN